MTDKTWKSIERKVAALLQGERVPVSGRQRGYAPDVRHELFSIEVKHRDQLPAWMFEAMRQAEASKKIGQIPVAILHQKGMPVNMSFTVFRLYDIIDLYNEISDLKKKVEELENHIRRQLS